MRTPTCLLAALLLSAASAPASTFSVSGSGNSFTISRSGDTSAAETVRYRTVALSAYPGQHFTEKYGTLTFPAGQKAVTNTVTARTPADDAYKFQIGTSRSYRFEVTDIGGFPITNAVRIFNTGTSVNSSNAFSSKDLPINTGIITVTDGGYDQAYHSVTVNNYFTAAAPKDYLVAAGAQLRATVTFHAREKDDGYQYVAIYANTSTSYVDTGAKDGDPGTVSYSRYMAGFTIDGNVSSTYYPYTFPLTSKGDNCGEQTHPWSGNGNGSLQQQYFNTGCRASDGRLIIPTDLSSLYVRLNASGNLNDTWYASNVVAHVQAVDSTAPSKLAFSVAPGVRARGNDLFVSVAFSEPVTCSSATLSTTWGKLSYNSGNGSNVLTFKGTISDAASGSLGITNRSGTVKDLAGNLLNGSLNQTSLATLDASHAYAISCDLAGGSASNPTTYTYDSDDIVLANPTRTGYVFDGWSGTGISGLANAVTIPARSHGDRAYAAHWTPITYTVHFDANGSTGTPMVDQTFTYDVATNLAANAFTRTGYTFDGWDYAGATYPDGAAVQNLTNESATVTLSARWTPVTYAVHFDPGAGTGVMPDQTFTYDVATNLAANAFARAHYAFAGWSGAGPLLPDGATVTNLAAAQGATVTLTATWTPAPTWTGAGTAESPYLIYNRDQLDDLAAYVNANDGSYRDSVYRLMADIAYDPAATNSFTPIGRTSSRFQGVFDGNGHTIGGISISRPDTNYQGLFGYLDIATVMNLTLADSSIEGYSYVGGLFGYAKNAAIRNCFVTGTSVAGNSDSGAVGGNAADCNLIKNAYHGCTRNGSADNRGIGNLGDTLDRVWPCGTLSFESGVEPFDGPDYAFPVYGTTNSYYAVGWPVDVRTAVAGATVFVNGSTNGVSGANGEFSFYMPNGDATVSSAVAYLDTNGDLQYCASYTVVTNAAADVEYGRSYGTSWYVVDGDVAIDGTLRFLDTYAHLILCDGATLAVTNASGSGYAIDAHDLRIYGQAGGTGAIAANGGSRGLSADNVTVNGGSVTADSDTESGRGIYATNFVTINGGTVNATGSYGISAHRSLTITGGNITANGILYGIFSFGTVTIGGGTVVATGSRNDIDADDGIILGWTDYADSITASSYDTSYGTVSVKDGQLLTDGTAVYQGEVDPAAIAGKTLRPYFVPYIDANGDGQVCTNYTVLTNAAGDVEYGESGAENWYVVTTDVTIGGQLSFNDDCTHLILCDGATITVTNGNGNAIYPSKNLDSSRVLVLYGQANGTGVLVANGSDYGIRAHGGSVTINGGNVIATGKGPGFFAGGDITINGGSVTATGHTIGIYAAADLIINGGSVTAEGTISGGIRAHSGSVTINGGNVSATVTGGTSDGIYADDDLTINGGSVTATATGGNNGIYAGGDVTINGGSVTATGGSDTANHNGIHAGGTFTINGGIVTATGGHYGIWANDITLGWTNPADSITASGYSGRVHVKDRQRLTDGDNAYRSIIRDPAAIAGKTLRPPMPAISYLDEDGVERQRYLYTVLTSAAGDVEYGTGAENWYVVTNAVTISGKLFFADDYARLILCDGATLAVTNSTPNGDAIYADYDLTIYGQTNGTGTVIATGNRCSIFAYNDLAINGGSVTATGGDYGIYVRDDLTINGDTVNATGDFGIAVGNSLAINGGTVTATSAYGTGIYARYDLTINGGNVTATSAYGTGIYAYNGTITLGWTDPADRIYASRYAFHDGPVSVKAGQFLTDGTTVYQGEVDPDDIARKTLVPYTTPWKSLQARLNAGGTVTLSEDATAEEDDATLVVTNTVTLDLNGHTIDADGRFCVIRVLEGGDLTLTNGVEGSGAIVNGHDRYDGNVYVSGGGVHVDGGAFTMAGGTICSNAVNLSTGLGGGVYVDGGTFEMTGGTICSNCAARSGGGVYVTRGSFEMSGGSIANNTASSGGGVYATDGSTFTISGGLIANNHAANGGGGVYVDGNSSRSTFTMTGGEISGNVVSNMSTANIISGGGVCVYGNGGAFAMTGGTILSNSVQGTVKPYGGGMYVEGVRQATMTGGTISGNFVTSTHTGGDADGASGGGVCVRICSFTMAGGEISGNRSSKNGGGVAMQGTTRHLFTMTGGTISGNEASCIGGNRIRGGGGVFMNGGTFAMTNGAISGNVADCTGESGYGGGGVYMNSGTFEMADSAISGNAAGNGGGVFVNNGTFKVSGVSVVSGNTNAVGAAANVYLPSGKEIAVDGLSVDASIGVTTKTAPTAFAPVTFATGAAAGDGRYFTSDDPAFAIEAANDVLNLVKPPTTPWNLLQAKLDAGGTVTLASGVTATDGDATLVVTNAVTLDLDGCTIDAAGRFGVIRVAAGGDLTLTNGFPESGAVTGGSAREGGGVWVAPNGAFTMTGGEISGNTAEYGGGVFVWGAFTMTGGAISGNTADDDGGGVDVFNGTFTMSGGEISGNEALADGGGVDLCGGAFAMTGGEISGNAASDGGGVYMYDGTFTMTGGEISGNTADYDGGGVYVDDSAFTMAGGEISGNAAEWDGGGVYVSSGTFTVSGSPVVSGNTNDVGAANNVHLYWDSTIAVDGLSPGAFLGVTTADAPTADAPVAFAAGAAAGDERCFTSDNPAYSVDTDEYGELCLVLSDPVAEPTPVATTWDFVISEGWTAIGDPFTGETNVNGRTWTLADCRVRPTDEAGGDTGYLALYSTGSAAVAPAFRGVVTQVTTMFRPASAGSTREVSLLASTDGGATFSVVTNVAVPVRQNYENTFVFDVPLDGGDLGVVFCASNSGTAGTVQLRRLTIEGTSTAPEEPGLHDWSPFGDVPAGQPIGALSGVVLFLDPGLGYAADPATNAWTTGAGLANGVVADFGNLDQMNFLARQAWKAGATIVPLRPLGYQTNEVVVDNADAARVTFGGAWANAVTNRHYGRAGDVGYRWTYACPTGATAWASYRPYIPGAGEYPVYAWAPAGPDRVPQLYRVRHAGGVTDVRVDHRRVGDGWVWLGSFRFAEGTAGCVNVSNYAPGCGEGSIVVADAIRFGNGMGDVARGAAGVSGLERELEASRYWIERQALDSQGFPASVYDGAGTDRADADLAPARMAEHMGRMDDGPAWSSILVALDDMAMDATTLKSLRGREALARDMLRDVVHDLAAFRDDDPAAATLPPDAPVAVAATNAGYGRATVSWRMPASKVSDPHTGFVVYASTDGYAFGNPVAVASAADEGSHTFDGLPAGEPYFFRVCAVNAGGESLPSPVAGVGLSFDGSAATVLLVDGFHRADAGLTPVRRYDRVAGADGPVDVPLVRPRMINSFDYVKEHGNAIAAAGRSFDSVDSALVTAADLAGHPFAVWFVGREGVETETLSYDEQRLIATFLDNRGFLFLSGSDIGRDLGSLGTASDRAFLEDRLRCTFVADDGETGIVGGQTGSFLAGVAVEFNYTNALDDIYAAGRAEVFAPCDVGFSAARYGGADGAETAIVAQQNTQATHPTQPRTILAGFPFETITDEHQRNTLMKKILDLFDASQKDPSWIGDTAYTTGVGGTVEISLKSQVEGWPSAAVTLAGSFDSSTGGEVDDSLYSVAADRFVFTAPAAGIYTFTFSAENAAGIIEQNVTVTVGNAPVWRRARDILLDLGAATAVDLRALVSGVPAPAIALDPDRTAADPATYGFDPATGILSLGPSDDPATNAFVFVATNEAGTDALAITNVIRRLDTDGDGIPDWWATEHFGGPTGCPNPNADSDGDRFDNLEEYRRLTDPLDRYSQPLPAYLGGAAPAVVTNYVDWAWLHGPDLPGLHLPAFLLNVAPAATPAELRIDGIEVGAEGATIRASATAGGAAVDLTKINGILAVEAGDTVTNLVPKAVRGATFSADGTTATIPVPSSDGFFLRARIGTSAP